MADYAEIADVHAYGGFTNPSDEDDALLQTLLSAASAEIDNHCGRVFSSDAETAITFTADNGLLGDDRTLWLPEDLCSTPTYAEGAVTVTLVPYKAPYDRIVRESGYWPDPTVVTGHWAYSETPPADIVKACLRLTVWAFHQRESTEGDRTIISNGVVILPNSWPKDVLTTLAPYRRVRVA